MLFRILILASICCSISIVILSCASDASTNEEQVNPIVGDWYVEKVISQGVEVKGPPQKMKDVSFLSIYADGTYESRGYLFDIRRGRYTYDATASILTLDNQAATSGERTFQYELIEESKLELAIIEKGQIGTITIELSLEKPAILK